MSFGQRHGDIHRFVLGFLAPFRRQQVNIVGSIRRSELACLFGLCCHLLRKVPVDSLAEHVFDEGAPGWLAFH
jgi:hypothetical protein